MARRAGPIRAVLFDLDDTLFLERQYVRSGFSVAGERLRQRLGRTERFEDWMWRRFLTGRRGGILDALNEHFALGLTARDIAGLVDLYRSHRPAIGPCRGVKALLAELRRRGFKLGLLSDGYQPAQRLKLAALGLRPCFDAVVFTQDMGRRAWKPSARGFVALRGKLAVPHSACAYVADNPAKDFLPGNRLGWLTIQWRRAGQLHADSPAPPSGRAKIAVRSGVELIRVLLGGARRAGRK